MRNNEHYITHHINFHNVHSCYCQDEIYDKKTYNRTFVEFDKISDGHYSIVPENTAKTIFCERTL